ncbi:hypothetical protein LGR51_12575 [Pseudomonas sp. NP21570]|nr:hypothetical protein [Pseudomonas sp. NP21570]
MKIKALSAALLLYIGPNVYAESIYLTCEPTKGPDYDIRTAYKSAPAKLREQFLKDAVMQAIAGLLVPPATSWEIDLTKKTIHSPEEPHKVMKDISISNSGIEGMSEFGTSYKLNRINGKLSYVVFIPETQRSLWESKHGGQLPMNLSYESQCTAAEKPAI